MFVDRSGKASPGVIGQAYTVVSAISTVGMKIAYPVPASCNTVTIKAWGGGGGGAFAPSQTWGVDAGGGGFASASIAFQADAEGTMLESNVAAETRATEVVSNCANACSMFEVL